MYVSRVCLEQWISVFIRKKMRKDHLKKRE